MDGVGEAPPSRQRSPSIKCYSPRGLIARLLAALRLAKKPRVIQRKQKMHSENRDLETPLLRSRCSMNGLNGHDKPGLVHRNDTSFALGVGCGLLYLIAASKNELGKMVELRKEMEILLQNMKGELQSKDELLKSLKQCDALACSITDIQESSSSYSHLSIHSQKPCVQPESRSNMVHNSFQEYNISEQGAEEINELHAEFEVELERLQLYLDGEAELEDTQQERVKMIVQDSCTESHSSSFDENHEIIDPQGATADASFGVPPVELERRLHELLEARLQERIAELESALECTTQKLIDKETEVTWWKDTAQLISHHVPETSRFVFRLDRETALKLK